MAATWRPVGPPTVLTVLDLTAFEEAAVRASADLILEQPTGVNAVAITFRADLHGAIAHTLDPWTWPTSSWATSVWVLPDPLYIEPDATLRIHYSRRVQGTPDGLRCEVVELDELKETVASREEALSDVAIEINSLDVLGTRDSSSTGSMPSSPGLLRSTKTRS